ncbi:hypothetical protein F4604DRAFT_1677679 [Suillus subluteus]|nr:hypothetical protein F4604DRAFT_1677679 [Suillus subluteus]
MVTCRCFGAAGLSASGLEDSEQYPNVILIFNQQLPLPSTVRVSCNMFLDTSQCGHLLGTESAVRHGVPPITQGKGVPPHSRQGHTTSLEARAYHPLLEARAYHPLLEARVYHLTQGKGVPPITRGKGVPPIRIHSEAWNFDIPWVARTNSKSCARLASSQRLTSTSQRSMMSLHKFACLMVAFLSPMAGDTGLYNLSEHARKMLQYSNGMLAAFYHFHLLITELYKP